VPGYNSNGLSIMAPEKVAEEALELVAEGGFSAVKLRLGRPDAAGDLAAIRAARKALPEGITLMCDFNQALDLPEALRRARMIDAEDCLLWIEEPIRADDFAGCARLAQEARTAIQIGENFSSPQQMAAALAQGACDFVMPDVQRILGVTGWLHAAGLAAAAEVPCSSHLFPEFSAHLLAVTPTRHFLEYMDWSNPLLAEKHAIKNGVFQIPSRPGAGIAWDEAAVERFRIDR
jgi:mandelate racemase